MELQYRYAEADDIPHLVEINVGTDPEYMAINQALFMSIVPQRRVLCAISGGRIVAMLHFGREFLGRTNLWYLEQITVDPAYRKQGIGLSLMKRMLETAKAEKAEKVFADVHNDNYASLRMCLAAGGLVSGTIEGVGSTAGKDERVIVRFEL